MIQRIKNWWFLRQNGHPSKEEIKSLAYKNPQISPKILLAAAQYARGKTLEEIAADQNITRERVRQYLLKYLREALPTWRVTYDRHDYHKLYRTSVFETPDRWRAQLMYRWWLLLYIFSYRPVKQISLYKHSRGIVYLKNGDSRSQNRAQLEYLKEKKYGPRSPI